MKCDRCRNPHPESTTMSRFNTQTICMPCEEKERAHPAYPAAAAAELAAVQRGEYNFRGVGLPGDLR